MWSCFHQNKYLIYCQQTNCRYFQKYKSKLCKSTTTFEKQINNDSALAKTRSMKIYHATSGALLEFHTRNLGEIEVFSAVPGVKICSWRSRRLWLPLKKIWQSIVLLNKISLLILLNIKLQGFSPKQCFFLLHELTQYLLTKIGPTIGLYLCC